MKSLLVFIVPLFFGNIICAQGPLLKAGDHFPPFVFEHVLNAPFSRLDLNTIKDNRLWIVNFWGTWCSPCLPEMKQLAKLQSEKKGKLQIIGLSNDPTNKLRKYIANNPSGLWFNSDTSSTLYQMLQLAYVGQALIIDRNKKIIAIVKTDSITTKLIDSILAGHTVHSNYEFLEKHTTADPFGVDSSTTHSLSIRGNMSGYQSMTMMYWQSPQFKGRRISMFNQTLPSLFRLAYNIISYQQLQLDSTTLDYKKIGNYSDKSQLYSIDLVVGKESSDSLYSILQSVLKTNTPIKARWENRKMDVGILSARHKGLVNAPKTKSKEKTYSFSGNGYEGNAVTIRDFADDYLSNEFHFPIVDETGLTDRFDITTHLDVRDKTNLLKSLSDLGLEIKKAEKELPVLVLYK